MEIKLSSISPGRNPRRHFDSAEMADLESSIRANGVLQPILVRPLEGDRYEIVAGERRWRAARAVYGDDGVIPAEVRVMTDDEADIAALVENTLRADMSPAEEAEAAQSLVEKFRGDKNAAATHLGWPLSKLYRRLGLMEATPAVREALSARKISLGHAELLAAAPRGKQDKVLEKVIAGNIPVAALKDQLSAISHNLEAAIFDKADCGSCPHNSSLQAQMFTESVAVGHCTNPGCFNAKTERCLESIVAAQKESVPRVEVLRPGTALDTVPVVAEGRVGVGAEQMEACRGCGNFGCTVSALPGAEGNIETELCFDLACNTQKVAEHLKALEEEKPEQRPETKGKSAGKRQVKGKPVVNQSAAPQRLKDYRLKVWKSALAAEIGKDVFTAGVALVAMAMTGNAHHIHGARIDTGLADGAIDEVYSTIAGKHRAELSTLIGKLPLAAVQGLSEADVRRLLSAMRCDLSTHWVMDAEFLGLLTKSEIEALAGEVGLKKTLGEDFKKIVAGKKDEVIEALLKVDGFTYRGAVPACMAYEESRKPREAIETNTERQATDIETCCA